MDNDQQYPKGQKKPSNWYEENKSRPLSEMSADDIITFRQEVQDLQNHENIEKNDIETTVRPIVEVEINKHDQIGTLTIKNGDTSEITDEYKRITDGKSFKHHDFNANTLNSPIGEEVVHNKLQEQINKNDAIVIITGKGHLQDNKREDFLKNLDNGLGQAPYIADKPEVSTVEQQAKEAAAPLKGSKETSQENKTVTISKANRSTDNNFPPM